ncbi:DUF2993 domain-containing protein [Microlunatus lacustris]
MASGRAGRRAGGVLLVLLLLAGALLGLDRGLHAYAERRVATELQNSLALAGPPAVEIRGFPFLTQAARNRFPRVDVTASGFSGSRSPGEPTLEIETLQAELHDVRTEDGYRVVRAGRLDGRAVLAYDALGGYSENPLSYGGSAGGPGRVQTKVSAPVGGDLLAATISGVVTVDEPNQQMVITEPAVEVVGVELGDEVVDRLAERFLEPIPVGALPLGLRLTGVEATETGMVARVTGTDVLIQEG